MKAVLLLGALLLTACSSTGTETPVPPDPPVADSAARPELPAPDSLAEGDRWFVAIRAGTGAEPVAERNSRTRGDGFVREEVTWGRSFADLARMEHGTAQVCALILDEKGLSIALLDPSGRPFGDPRLEVSAPFRVGTGWLVRDAAGYEVSARIAAIEKVETPGGAVEAIRVEGRWPAPRPYATTTWYDASLRPVRAVYRESEGGAVLEARAALASSSPTPEECRAAMEWAKKSLPAPAK